MTGQKGRSGGARPGAGRPLTDVYRVVLEQIADGQAVLSRRNGEISVQFPDEEQPIPLKDLAYSQEIGLYDKRRFPSLHKQESEN